METFSTLSRSEYDSLRYQKNKEHRKSQVKERNDKHQSMVREIKLEKGCSHCGTKEDVTRLQFHHVDSSSKKFNIAESRSNSWENIEKEMAKCIILCQECHTNEHQPTRLGTT